MCAADAGKEAGDWKLEQQALQGDTACHWCAACSCKRVSGLQTVQQQCLISHNHIKMNLPPGAASFDVQSRTGHLDQSGTMLLALAADACVDVSSCWRNWAFASQIKSATHCIWLCDGGHAAVAEDCCQSKHGLKIAYFVLKDSILFS